MPPVETSPTPLQHARISQFEELDPPPGAALFLGDSITESGHWSGWFPHLVTINRGVGGDTIAGVRRRLDSAVADPALISLLIGTNDLSRTDDVASIATQFTELVNDLRERAPRARLIITGVMPRAAAYSKAIAALNARYAETSTSAGATWIDLKDAIGDERGALAERFTYDGLHLLGAGYRVWSDALRPHL